MVQSKIDIAIIGGADTDCIALGERLPQAGESVAAVHFQSSPGGKGVNQAIAAARQGARVALIAMLGNDQRGDEIRARLESEGVNTMHVLRTANAATGATLIMIGMHGKTMRMAVPGANRLLLPDEIAAASDTIRSAGILLAQLEVPLPAVRRAFWLARDAGVRTMLDAAPATALDEDMLRLTDILRANTEEALAITGIPVSDRHCAIRAGQFLLAHGVSVVALETGDSGNLVMDSSELHAFSPLPVEPVDRTGAGDAFSAIFALGLMEGRGLAGAGWRASAAAAWAVTLPGALGSLPARAELDAFIARHQAPAGV